MSGLSERCLLQPCRVLVSHIRQEVKEVAGRRAMQLATAGAPLSTPAGHGAEVP